jgi:hypothetical protein
MHMAQGEKLKDWGGEKTGFETPEEENKEGTIFWEVTPSKSTDIPLK